MNTTEIQNALHARGYDPGVPDGIRGRRTIAAIRAFQQANGLVADGIVGPLTAKALFGAKVPDTPVTFSVELPWYSEAWRLLGIREDTGAGSNDLLLKWAEALDIAYGDDEIPWCGLFVAHCIGSQLTSEPLPNGPLGARNWLKFGVPVKPQPGAVMVFWRGSQSGWAGHVGFYAGEEKNGAFHILGGNQADKVSVTRIARDRLLGARWPTTVPLAAGKPKFVGADGVPVAGKEN